MFESAELGHAIDKQTYEQELPVLRQALLTVQDRVLEAAKFPVIIVIGGVDGAGKGETVNLLNEWMDPRHIATHAFGEPSDEERARPPMWRFWRALPPKGKLGIFFGSWYTQPIVQRVYGETGNDELGQGLAEIVRFERMLTDEGALLLKFWFHLSRKRQKARLEELESSARTRWRVTESDWKHFKLYDKFRRVSERALRETSRGHAAWTVVEGTDPRYRSLTVGRAVLAAMQARLGQSPAKVATPSLPVAGGGLRVTSALDMSARLDKQDYPDQLEKYQRKLSLLLRHKRFRKHSLVALFEGQDAGGKGGSIRRITQALDARHYSVIPVAAPTDEERAQPYLWRFWRHIPARGRVTLFDRSWYGRVLVERVEGYCATADWLRGYDEINDFEEELTRHGTVLVKLWLEVSPAEQLRRFQEREQIGFKRYKITPDDWRNREKGAAYGEAMSDMVERTSTAIAPWTLIAADDKYHARITVLKTLCRQLAEVVD